jgi:CubicO group peptidase (beta-lactamase class C family)
MDGLRGTAAVLVDGSLTEVTDGHSPDTLFQIASVSKQIAATAVLLLAGRGKLDLHEPIDRWFPGHWADITLHHLLSHTAGFGHWSHYGDPDDLAVMSTRDRIALFQRTPPRTLPGAEWHYSSIGYLITAEIVGRAADRPYPEFLAERIFAPLGLTATTATTPREPTVGHHDGKPVPPWKAEKMAGTGDVWSTAKDLAHWTAALHHGDLVPPATLIGPYAPVPTAPDTEYGYGLFSGTLDGLPIIFHTGDNPGFKSISVWLPDHEASIVVLTNDTTTDVDRVLRQLVSEHGFTAAADPESP